MRLLLDTCTFVWLVRDPGKLGPKAAALLSDPANERSLSLASVWEIALKHRSGRFALPSPPRVWVEYQRSVQAIDLLNPSLESIYRSAELTGSHADPFDRLIAAQAIESRLTLLSPDAAFTRFGCAAAW